MMLKVRVIPCLDVKDGRVVKGVRFVDLTDAGDPVEAARAYDAAGADELCFLDITASHENRGILLDVVARTAEQCFMPVTVGGGVRTVEDVRALLLAGADKVSINTARGRDRADRRARPRRSSAPRRSSSPSTPSAVNRGRRRRRPLGDLHPWRPQRRPASTPSPTPRRSRELGAGEILLTSMDRDGTGDGFDLALTRAIADAVPVPVVASGGVGTLDHLVEGVTRRPRLGGARRLDLPLRHLYDPRRPRSTWRRSACRCGSTAESRMSDFTLADLAAIIAERARAGRSGDVLHGEAARRRRRALRQEIRRGGGRGGARRGRRRQAAADRGGGGRALPPAGHAEGGRRRARRR